MSRPIFIRYPVLRVGPGPFDIVHERRISLLERESMGLKTGSASFTDLMGSE